MTFVIVTLLCVGIWTASTGSRRQQAVAEVCKWGAKVTYHYEYDDDGRFVYTESPPGPQWARRLLGDHFFSEPRNIELLGESIDIPDYVIKRLGELESVEDLDFTLHAVTDAQLEAIGGLSRLKVLNLDGSLISDAGLRYLSGLRELRSLHLRGTSVSDDGLSLLQSLPRLTYLDISSTLITDKAIDKLLGLRELRKLTMQNVAVTDIGFARLALHTELTDVLIGDGTRVTDAGVAAFRQAAPRVNVHSGDVE